MALQVHFIIHFKQRIYSHSAAADATQNIGGYHTFAKDSQRGNSQTFTR